ncbi:MAG: rRNA pseudouridine synthase [Clostridia bacterium]|nr:rRNA pseudouridine synthase [Clostridia bacterium]
MSQPVRLQKYFTDCGILSRRHAEEEIAAGRVLVNGKTAALGDKITPGVDLVTYQGKPVVPKQTEHTYLLLNKPRGFVTTAKDEKGRPTVTELVRSVGVRVYPVGRLDLDSDGLLILTDDGEFANYLTHPRHHVAKTYRVCLSTDPSAEQLQVLASPMELDGYKLRPVEVEKAGANTLLMTLHEGRNRQVRKMCEAVGLTVTTLTRISIGEVKLGSLKKGAFRHLTKKELQSLYPKEEKQDV